jgi:hypothetical protein
MAPNACFENSAAFVMRSGMTYVEGYALTEVPSLFAFEHAWCIDSNGEIHELTWDRPALAYFGVGFGTAYVARRFAAASHPEHGILRTDDGSLFSGLEHGWRP